MLTAVKLSGDAAAVEAAGRSSRRPSPCASRARDRSRASSSSSAAAAGVRRALLCSPAAPTPFLPSSTADDWRVASRLALRRVRAGSRPTSTFDAASTRSSRGSSASTTRAAQPTAGAVLALAAALRRALPRQPVVHRDAALGGGAAAPPDPAPASALFGNGSDGRATSTLPAPRPDCARVSPPSRLLPPATLQTARRRARQRSTLASSTSSTARRQRRRRAAVDGRGAPPRRAPRAAKATTDDTRSLNLRLERWPACSTASGRRALRERRRALRG